MKPDILLALAAALHGDGAQRDPKRLIRRARRAVIGFRPAEGKYPGLSGNSYQRRVARRAAETEAA